MPETGVALGEKMECHSGFLKIFLELSFGEEENMFNWLTERKYTCDYNYYSDIFWISFSDTIKIRSSHIF